MTERKPRKPNLRPVREVTPSLQFRTVHGYRRAFRIAGSGPVILLIHGIGDNSTTWAAVQAKLAQRFTVITVDLLGHGQSDKSRADYSVAAYANGMRDLHSVLDIERVTVISHSLGAAWRCSSPTSSPSWSSDWSRSAPAVSPRTSTSCCAWLRCRWAARRWRCCGCR